jgi:hypothetical protein
VADFLLWLQSPRLDADLHGRSHHDCDTPCRNQNRDQPLVAYGAHNHASDRLRDSEERERNGHLAAYLRVEALRYCECLINLSARGIKDKTDAIKIPVRYPPKVSDATYAHDGNPLPRMVGLPHPGYGTEAWV